MIGNDPKLKANRYPWNRDPSAARLTVEGFLAAAERQLKLHPEDVPFHWIWGSVVLAWLRTRLNTPPDS